MENKLVPINTFDLCLSGNFEYNRVMFINPFFIAIADPLNCGFTKLTISTLDIVYVKTEELEKLIGE